MIGRDEDDRALGAAVRAALGTGGVGSDAPDSVAMYARSLQDDSSFFGAAVFQAIADALRAESP